MLPKIQTFLYATDLDPGARISVCSGFCSEHQAKIVVVHGIESLSSNGQSLVEQYIFNDS